uniref:mucin-5AC-like n=1 Tax=Podarcis muralis TaxID=64176 RepID=UPI00109FA5B5|nr:mucin-5AC-like [Podarcis muralis]
MPCKLDTHYRGLSQGSLLCLFCLVCAVLSKWLLAAADTQIQEPSLAGMPLSDAEYEHFFSILHSPRRIRAVCFLRAMYGCQNSLIRALDQYENHGVVPEGRVCSDLEEHSTFPDFCNLAFYRCALRKYYVKRVPCPGDRNKARTFLQIISPPTEPDEIVQSSIEEALTNLLRASPAASMTTPELFPELLTAVSPSTTDAAKFFSELLRAPAALAATELAPERLTVTSDKATTEPLPDILEELSHVSSTTTIATKSPLELIEESSLENLAQSVATIASESLLEPLVTTSDPTTAKSFTEPPMATPTSATETTPAFLTTTDAVATAESISKMTSAPTTTELLSGVLSGSSPEPPVSTATSTAAEPLPQLLSASPPVSASGSFPEPLTTTVATSTESSLHVATTTERSSKPPNSTVTTAAESSATHPTTTTTAASTTTSAKALCLCVSESPTLPKEATTTTKAPMAITSSTITTSPQPLVSTPSVAQKETPQSSSSKPTVITPTSTEQQKAKPEDVVGTSTLLPTATSPVVVTQQEKIPKPQVYLQPTASLAELFFRVQDRKVEQLMQAMRDLLTKRRREQLRPTSSQPLKTLTHASRQKTTKQSPKLKDRLQR